VHEHYDSRAKIHDVALLRLASAPISKPHIGTVCLPTQSTHSLDKLEDTNVTLTIVGESMMEKK